MSLRDAVRLNHGLRGVIDQLTFDGANQDIVLSRGAANRLDLASGDSLSLVDGSLTINKLAVGVTTTAGLTLQNTTAAAAGAQQYSPSFSLIGRGWETNVGSSMPVEALMEVRPVQGTAAPTYNLVMKGRVNEGAWSDLHTVTSAGSFGIGTTGPDGTLHVHRASAGSVTAHPNADELIVENSGDAGLSLLTPDANVGYVAFGSPTDNFGAWLRWKHDDNDLQLGTSKTGGFISLLTGNGVAAVRITTGGNFGVGTTAAPEKISQGTANGATWGYGQVSELLTLSTSGTTSDTTANLLPANSIIEAVVARVTTTITTATSWQLGDASTAGRFTAANSTMTAGTTGVGLVHVDVSGAGGPRQTAAAKVRVTTVGTPGAGAIRITVFYRTLVPPTS